MTPFGEPDQSWELSVNKNGLNRQTTALRIDAVLIYRLMVSVDGNGKRTHVVIRTPDVSDQFSGADDPASIDPATVSALEDIAYYRSVMYSALRGVLTVGGLDFNALEATCASSCADDNPQPADCDGWWDSYQCCITEADKDGCRMFCECSGGWFCEAAVAVITTLDHEACVVGLAF